MVAPLPLAKIGLLVLKRLTKPLANTLKNEAKKHPRFRESVIIPVGRACGWIEQKATYDALKNKKNWKFEKISETEAVELGADAIGEIIVIGLLTVILFAEYSRQGEIKATAKRTKEQELKDLMDSVVELVSEVDSLKKTVREIEAEIKTEPVIYGLEDKTVEDKPKNGFDWDYY